MHARSCVDFKINRSPLFSMHLLRSNHTSSLAMHKRMGISLTREPYQASAPISLKLPKAILSPAPFRFASSVRGIVASRDLLLLLIPSRICPSVSIRVSRYRGRIEQEENEWYRELCQAIESRQAPTAEETLTISRSRAPSSSTLLPTDPLSLSSSPVCRLARPIAGLSIRSWIVPPWIKGRSTSVLREDTSGPRPSPSLNYG